MRVLAVCAHPDDIEILCGGTVARMAAEGHEVVMASATDGSRGGEAGTDPAELRVRRGREAAEAARIAGCAHRCVGIHDGEVSSANPQQARAFVDLVREVEPDLVLTHHPEDYHPDHREVSRLAFNASFAAANPMIGGPGTVPARVPALYYADTLAGLGFAPTEYVDVSEYMEVKRRMLAAHVSQLGYLKENFGSDILDEIETVARFRGLQCGVRYAEAFALCTAWHRPRAHRLLP